MKMMHGAALPRLIEQVADPCGADADKHLNELRTRDREERHAGLAGDGTCDQCLAGAGRSDEEMTFGNAGAETAVSLLVLQKRDNFLQLELCLVDAFYIGEGHLRIALDINLCLRFTD